jgi:hypothetical protein
MPATLVPTAKPAEIAIRARIRDAVNYVAPLRRTVLFW